MNKIEIVIDGKTHKFSGPSSYSEVPEKMIMPLLELVRKAAKTKGLILAIPAMIYGIPEQIWRIFFHSRAHYRYIALDAPEEEDALTDLGIQILDTVKWVFTETPPATWLKKSITIGKDVYFSPADRLANITYGEFVLSQTYIHRDLAKLCALLYRKGKNNKPFSKSDARCPFEQENVADDAAVFSSSDLESFRHYVFWNYHGCLEAMSRGFPHALETKKNAGDNQVKAVPSSKNPFMEATFALAEEDPRRYNDLLKENVYVVLKILDDRIKRNKEMEKEMNKIKRKK